MNWKLAIVLAIAFGLAIASTTAVVLLLGMNGPHLYSILGGILGGLVAVIVGRALASLKRNRLNRKQKNSSSESSAADAIDQEAIATLRRARAALRAQRTGMNRRLVSAKSVLLLLIALLTTLSVLRLVYSGLYYHFNLRDLVDVTSLVFAFTGIHILKEVGYRKYPLRHIIGSFIFTVTCAVTLIFLPLSKSTKHVAAEFLFYLLYASLAAMFPISLYLRHSQKNLTPQPTIANVH